MRPQLTGDFFRAVVDSISESLCVIDHRGDIVYVNASWREFGRSNGASRASCLKPGNYLQICDRAASLGQEQARDTAIGLRRLLRSETPEFSIEYPCHSPDEQRWFILAARPMLWRNAGYFVIQHTDITERKLAELEVQKLSLTDRLTGLANRRHFDDFLARAWAQHMRDGQALTLILLDADHFKRLNDRHGHLAGDACLRRLAALLSTHARRPGDLAARYGGEEMALVLSGIELDAARELAETIRGQIERLGEMDDQPKLTASFGVASIVPARGSDPQQLIAAADKAMYRAKREGRNRVCLARSELAA